MTEMNFNKKKTNKTDKGDLFALIVFSIVAIKIVFWDNPIWWILYGIVLGAILFLIGKDRSKETFALCFGFCYILIALVISSSPFLRIKDFQLFHPHYKLLKEFTITKADYDIYHSSTRGGYMYAYAIIDYAYTIDGEEIQHTEEDVVKWDTEGYKANKKKLANIVKSNDFFVFVNPKRPTESKMFYSNKYVYLKGCEGFYFFRDMFLVIVMMAIFLVAGNIIYYLIKKE